MLQSGVGGVINVIPCFRSTIGVRQSERDFDNSQAKLKKNGASYHVEKCHVGRQLLVSSAPERGSGHS
jgi:hypothetical protein